MMYCNKCGLEFPDNFSRCSKCFEPLSSSRDGEESTAPVAQEVQHCEGGSTIHFIVPGLAHVVYWIMNIVAVISSISLIFSFGFIGFMLFPFVLALELVIVRIWYELTILFFECHKELKCIRKMLGAKQANEA